MACRLWLKVRMSAVSLRATINRLRRWTWQTLHGRLLFGERDPASAALRPHTRIAPTTVIDHAAGLQLGDHVFIGHFNFLEASAGLVLEDGVQITNYCSLVTHSTHRSVRLLGRLSALHAGARSGDIRAPIHVGAYSYIGPHSLLEAGTTLGRGSLVAAFSRVRGEHPPFAVLAGQPAVQVGDTRQRDASWLQNHPQLRQAYIDWAGALPDGMLADEQRCAP